MATSTILIVDDLEQNRYLLRTLLEAAGYTLQEASNGAEALRLARSSPPDLIVSDILMPQMDGFAFCRECKSDEQLNAVPFVFYTATYTDPRDEALAMQLGAERFITKPVENEDLLAALKEALQTPPSGVFDASPPAIEQETVFYRLYNEALIRKLEDKMLALDRLNRGLAESEERFRRLAENAQDLIFRYEFSPRRGFTYVSPAATFITGYTPAEYYADPDLGLKLVHPADLPLLDKINSPTTAPGQPFTLRWLHKDNRVIWIEQRNTPVFGPSGEMLAIEGIARDITPRKQRESELEILAAISATLRLAHSRAEMLPILLDQLLELLEVHAAALVAPAGSGGEMLVELGRGAWSAYSGSPIPAQAGLSARIIAGGQPYLNNDMHHEADLLYQEAFQELCCAACAPLSTQGQVIGLLWVGSLRTLTDHDLRLLLAIAEMAANAIHRASLHDETVRRVEQLEALQTIDRAITAGHDLDLSLNVLLEQTLGQLQADAAGVLIYDPTNLMLNYAAGRGFYTINYKRSQLRLGIGLAGKAALERSVLHSADLPANGPSFARRALLAGEGFVSYAVAPLVSKGLLQGVLEIFYRSQVQPDDERLNFLKALAQQAAIAVDSAQLFDNLQKSNMELSLAYDATIEGWSRALDLRDQETEGHTLRVTEMALRLAKAAGIDGEELVHVRRGALLHDIGKMGIPDEILHKPSELTAEEWAVMHKHPQYAYDMLQDIAYLRPALDIPYCHHEKWDGSGYPRGLKGEQIPLIARLFAVMDVWDALTSDRPYRKAWSKEKALEYLHQQSGSDFDPQAVELFLSVLGE